MIGFWELVLGDDVEGRSAQMTSRACGSNGVFAMVNNPFHLVWLCSGLAEVVNLC